tara:strand:+ start:450 stop:902 length:453 start_codon:yes stop_codon:yes gene_type:complete
MAKKEKEERRSVLDSVRDFARNVANDIAIGTGIKDDPDKRNDGFYDDYETPYEARTRNAVAAINARNAASSGDDNSSLAQSNRAAAQRAAMSSAAAPSLPNADGVGATEQALLDANKKGRSSTIATSAAGLLAGEDSTRKKRSLIGGLIR